MKQMKMLGTIFLSGVTACTQAAGTQVAGTQVADAPLESRQAPQLPPVQADWSYNIGSSDLINGGAVPTGKVISLDLHAIQAPVVARLRAQGKYVICYYSAGSSENYRTDEASRRLLAPELNLGEVKRGENEVWAGERWLDIRGFGLKDNGRLSTIRSVMTARLDLARQKGCQAVEPDNVDAWANTVNQNAPAGTPAQAISAADQLAYNRWTADAAHARGLAVLLKNDLEQIPDLVGVYDGALNEECFDFQQDCEALIPFRDAKKAIYVVLYHTPEFATEERKKVARQLHLNVILTDLEVRRLNPYSRFGKW